MPQSDSHEPSLLGTWPGYLLVLLMGVGVFNWVQNPFEPERPTEAKEGLAKVSVQDVDARLWQDPFAAVIGARAGSQTKGGGGGLVPPEPDAGDEGQASGKPGGNDRHDLMQLSQQIRSRGQGLYVDPKLAAHPLTVLAIMVRGGPSPGAAEARRRYRYAALSALMLENFFPDDAEHIGYVDLTRNAHHEHLPDFLPFEWFTRKTDHPAHQNLLLLWLDEGPLRQAAGTPTDTATPLAHIATLLTGLYQGAISGSTPGKTDSGPPLSIGFQLIGPTSSGTLQEMAREYRAYIDAMDFAPPLPSSNLVARIWSPLATIPDPFDPLDDPLRPVPPSGAPGSDYIAVMPPTPDRRTIASDDILARMLIAELFQRGVQGQAGIALVGQWDTDYARILAFLLEVEWLKKNGIECKAIRLETQTKSCEPARGQNPKQIEGLIPLRFSYMRGLDGQIPGARPMGQDKGGKDDPVIERPVGDAQIDYLRRMRDALLAEDLRLRRACDLRARLQQRCGVRAIGVLGDDYYDKILVLQALKPVFPNAVFFTTDLDAAMLHPKDNPFTRNLIVAAGYGLTLNKKDWQREIPPLRDSYQTALLLTVRLAAQDALGIHQTELGTPTKPQKVALPPPARLFEIGRTHPVELVPGQTGRPFLRQGADSAARTPYGVPLAQDPHPPEELIRHFPTLGAANPAVVGILLPAALLLVSALVVGAVGRERSLAIAQDWGSRLRRGWLPLTVTLFTVLAIALILVLMAHDLKSGGEPFSLLEGVSIWPSEILRLIAGLIALFFFMIGHRRQQQTHRRIESEFPGLSGVPPAPGEHNTAGDTVRCDSLLTIDPLQVPIPVAELWRRYVEGCGIRKTLLRIWPEVLLFLLLAFCLMLALGFPNRPTRSPLSWWLDFGVIQLVLIPFLLLLFFMVDATRKTLKLAQDLSGPVTWPASTLRARGLSAWGRRQGPEVGEGADIVWLDVKLIANVTKPVGDLVWYPVVVLILIAVARHPLFDAWTLPPALVVVMSLAIVYAIGCALLLRRAAEQVREEAIRELNGALLRAQAQPDKRVCLDQIGTMLSEIARIRDGAFRPFSQQPVVQALLTLASSVSGLALLQYSSAFNL